VSFLGHTDDPSEELRAADVLLVPTSIPLGIRVRILTGLAHGSVIVSHTANALGIPELEHDANALLGGGPSELVAALARTRDPELGRRLGHAARRTYEDAFAPPVAARAIEELLSGVAARVTVGPPAR
jgi:glycosyltransferase involved in cell wall biosynthesis